MNIRPNDTPLNYALAYAALNWPVFPVHWIEEGQCSCGRTCNTPGKHPMTARGHLDATTNPDQITAWWTASPKANIAVATGGQAGLVCLDIDPRNGGDPSFEALNQEIAGLAQTVAAKTGGGGHHFFFKTRVPLRCRISLRPGIDVKANGGYVVLAPSVHTLGKYAWLDNASPFEMEPAPIPDALFEKLGKTEGKSQTKVSENPGLIPVGERNPYLTSQAGKLRHADVPEEATLLALQEINLTRLDVPLDDVEVRRIVKSVFRYEAGNSEYKLNAPDLAREFLSTSATKDGEPTLRRYGGDFLKWIGTHYEKVSEEDVKNEIMAFLEQIQALRKGLGNRFRNDVVEVVKSIISVPSSVQLSSWISKSDLNQPHFRYVAMKNGVLRINALTGETSLLPNSSDFLALGSVPYSYDPSAACPIFSQFLNTAQPEPDAQKFLMEWLGYNLIQDTKQGKFLVMVGEGANGKSVCCLVLRELLGEHNVTAVGLEAFSGVRTFPLAMTYGKLANIISELGEIDKVKEETLKAFVAGDPIGVERKHRDGFTMIPTARITIATNVLPHLGDRSEGIWRRCIVLPFENQVLDERKQDRRLVDPSWWRMSGELPGVLNLAIAGLVRLLQRGHFEMPAKSVRAQERYRKDVNPTRAFLLDAFEETPNGRVGKGEARDAYESDAQLLGYLPLGYQRFAEEIRRVFKNVSESPNAISYNGKRERVWLGLQKKSPLASEHVTKRLDQHHGTAVPDLNSIGLTKLLREKETSSPGAAVPRRAGVTNG